MTLFDTIKKWIDNSLFINFMIETLGDLIMFGVVLWRYNQTTSKC